MTTSDELQARLVDEGVVPKLVALLRSSPPEVQEGHTLALNALACASEAVRGHEGAVGALAERGGLRAVLSRCAPGLPERLQEAAADVVAAVACVEGARPGLVELGAVDALCSLLATPNNDVRVRALMGLGMLLPASADSQVAVARNAAAVSQLLALMRQQEDLDCRAIARDIFAGLANNKDCKDLVAQAMRA